MIVILVVNVNINIIRSNTCTVYKQLRLSKDVFAVIKQRRRLFYSFCYCKQNEQNGNKPRGCQYRIRTTIIQSENWNI